MATSTVGDRSGLLDFLGRTEVVRSLGVSILAVHAHVQLRCSILRAQFLEHSAVRKTTIIQHGGGRAERSGDTLQIRHEFVGITDAGRHVLSDDELTALGIHDRLRIRRVLSIKDWNSMLAGFLSLLRQRDSAWER
jgi:hypothetical protein